MLLRSTRHILNLEEALECMIDTPLMITAFEYEAVRTNKDQCPSITAVQANILCTAMNVWCGEIVVD